VLFGGTVNRAEAHRPHSVDEFLHTLSRLDVVEKCFERSLMLSASPPQSG
jgi:hypothetical protein